MSELLLGGGRLWWVTAKVRCPEFQGLAGMSRPLCQQSPHSAPSVKRDDFQYPSQCFIGELHSADEADNGCLLLEHQPRACISEAAWCPEGPMVRTAASPSPGGNDQTCEQAQALAPIP